MSARDGSDTLAESSPVAGIVAVLLAWLVPGAGHLYLGRRRRAIAFFCIVLVATLAGAMLDGNLYRIESGRPLSVLGTFAAFGTGSLYLVLRFVVGHVGDIVASGYEYGTAFLLTAGLMNWLLVLDCWDIVLGRKE